MVVGRFSSRVCTGPMCRRSPLVPNMSSVRTPTSHVRTPTYDILLLPSFAVPWVNSHKMQRREAASHSPHSQLLEDMGNPRRAILKDSGIPPVESCLLFEGPCLSKTKLCLLCCCCCCCWRKRAGERRFS